MTTNFTDFQVSSFELQRHPVMMKAKEVRSSDGLGKILESSEVDASNPACLVKSQNVTTKQKCPTKPSMLILLLLVFSFIKPESVRALQNKSAPIRLLPADKILFLDDNSTIKISTLDEYLMTESSAASRGQIEREAQAEPQTLASTTSRPVPSNKSSSSSLYRNIIEKFDLMSQESTTLRPTTVAAEERRSAIGPHGPLPATSTNGTSQQKPIPQHWQVKSLLNVTQDYPLAYSQIINGYIWPLMALITLFTNLMIVFVLTQKDMKTPTNVVLTAIAIADIIPILVPVPWLIYLFAMGNEKQVLYPPMACYFYQHSTRSVSEIFYFLSTWLNVLLAVQDYLTACRPNTAKKWCQIKVVILEIVVLTTLAFLLNLPQALKLVFKPIKFYYNGQLTMGCRALQAKWFKDLIGEYVALYDDIFTAIIVLFVDGGPAIALIVLTALLIKQLHRQRIQGHLLMEQARTASKRRLERHRQQEYESSARVMIFVLLAFLAVKIPFATTYTLMIIQSRFDIHFVESLNDFQKAISITDLVFVLSYPINFTIFCCCSKKFRHKCIQLFFKYNQNRKSLIKRNRERLNRSFSNSFYSDSILSRLSSSITRRISESRKLSTSKRNSIGSQTGTLYSNGQPRRTSQQQQQYRHQRPLATIMGSSSASSASKTHSDGGSTIRHMDNNFEISYILSQSKFKSQLEDGSLCLECIMRYEQLRRRRCSESEPQPLAGPYQGSNLRRQSSFGDDSSLATTIWPPPPPPEPISALAIQQELPHIITTRCESIREQESLELANSRNNEADSATAAQADEQQCDMIGADRSRLTRGLSRSNGSKLRGSSDPGTSGLLDSVKQQLAQMQLLRRTSGGSSNSPGELADNRSSKGSLSSRKGAMLSFSSKKRSISMSDSKLAVLPNATGLLADIILSTVIGGKN